MFGRGLLGELVGWQVLREGTIHLVPYGWAGHAVGYAAEHGGLPGVTAVTFMGTTAGPATDRGGLAGLHLSVASKQGVPRSVSPKPTGVDPRKLGADKIDGDPQQLARITVGELPPAGQKRGGPEALPASSGTDEGLRQGSSIDDRPMEPDDGVADYRSPDEPRPNSVVRSDGIVSESRVESSTPPVPLRRFPRWVSVRYSGRMLVRWMTVSGPMPPPNVTQTCHVVGWIRIPLRRAHIRVSRR